MTMTDIVLSTWILAGTIVGAIVARKPLVTMIRVPSLTGRKDRDFGGYLFVVKRETPSCIVLGRVDHTDAIQAKVVDGKVAVTLDEGNMADVSEVTEDRLWIRRT